MDALSKPAGLDSRPFLLRALQPRSPFLVICRWQTPGHPAEAAGGRHDERPLVTSGSAGRPRTAALFMGPEPLMAEQPRPPLGSA